MTYISKNEGRKTKNGSCIEINYTGSQIESKRVFSNVNSLQTPKRQYSIKFDEDLDFVKGEKLHGSRPKNPVQGGSEGRPNGWRLRILFEEHGLL
jgi:hypothetical protein